MNPKVTIITPSYNQAQFLEKTILSVLNQDYPNIEYIIIDGGSKDGSVDIIKKYEKQLAYWISEPDRGQSHAINKGLEKANGEIIGWLNSDDVYKSGAVSIAVKCLLDYKEAAMVYGDCDHINELDQVVSHYKSPQFNLRKLLQGDFISQPSAFVRKNVFDEVGLIDEDLKYAMDYDLWLRIAPRFTIQYIPYTLAQFRFHDSSKSVSQNEGFLPETVIVLDKFLLNNNIPMRLLNKVHSRMFWLIMHCQNIHFERIFSTLNGDKELEDIFTTLKKQVILPMNLSEIIYSLYKEYRIFNRRYTKNLGYIKYVYFWIDFQRILFVSYLFNKSYRIINPLFNKFYLRKLYND